MARFQEEDITFIVLPMLNDGHPQKLGITIGRRRGFMEAVTPLKNSEVLEGGRREGGGREEEAMSWRRGVAKVHEGGREAGGGNGADVISVYF